MRKRLNAQDLPAEFGLTAACAAWPRTPARNAIIRARAEAVDWPLFVEVVERHRIAGLAYDGLVAAKVDMPPATELVLADAARQVARNELFLVSEAIRLTRAIEALGIDVAVLKGLTVALSAFGRLGLRYNHDVDLLVDISNVPAAAALLGNHGYVRIEPQEDASPAAVATWMKQHKDMVFEHRDHGSIVELHWRLFDNIHLLPGIEQGEWATASLGPGTRFRTLPADTVLLYLCVHGAQHAWSRLKWLAEIGAIVGQMTPEALAAFYADARARGVSRAVAPALLLCSDLFGHTPPQGVISDARADWRIPWLYETSVSSMVGNGDGTELEEQRFGAMRKNLSHYLMKSGLKFWLAEASYDLSDESGSDSAGQLSTFGPFGRIGRWLWRRGSGVFAGSPAS